MNKNEALRSVTTGLLVIGAGPAGLFAALSVNGTDVVVLEKNPSAGRKLLISGSGRCNITHDGAISEFTAHYGQQARFLRSALYGFTNAGLIDFFTREGLETVADKNGKLFPKSQKAGDVLKVLLQKCEAAGVKIVYNQQVVSISRENGLFLVSTDDCRYQARFLLIATGGMSYPVTGSTGDGYLFSKALGHRVIPPKPSLSPVIVSDYTFAALAGVSVDSKEISIYRENRKVASRSGDIVFTHKGLSGPGILDFSGQIKAGDVLKINFAGISPEVLRSELIALSSVDGKLLLTTFFKKYDMPKSLLLSLMQLSGLNAGSRLTEVTKEQRSLLIRFLCESPFTVSKVGGFNVAMVTAGGVALQDIDPATMQSKLVPGLFFAGEVLDVDGDTGGYNLQAAFSTACAAAKCISSLSAGK